MKPMLNKKLFFSMTYDFLTVYIPQDSASSRTVKTYRDGLTVFRRYVTEVKGFSIRTFTSANVPLILYLNTETGC